MENNAEYKYELKKCLMTESEKKYFEAIKANTPDGYIVQPQVNLAAIVEKTDKSRFVNELFRNIDFCIFNEEYKPVILFEINDSTHNEAKRKERDEKVKNICEEAGIQLFRLWTSYGINEEYIRGKIEKGIENADSVERIKHSAQNEEKPEEKTEEKKDGKKSDGGACYIATAVYGSYDAPEVMTLRRFRDEKLKKNSFGRLFIRTYYFISPKLVRLFGNNKRIKGFCRKKLDKFVYKLENER